MEEMRRAVQQVQQELKENGRFWTCVHLHLVGLVLGEKPYAIRPLLKPKSIRGSHRLKTSKGRSAPRGMPARAGAGASAAFLTELSSGGWQHFACSCCMYAGTATAGPSFLLPATRLMRSFLKATSLDVVLVLLNGSSRVCKLALQPCPSWDLNFLS